MGGGLRFGRFCHKKHKDRRAMESLEAPIGAREISAGRTDAFCVFRGQWIGLIELHDQFRVIVSLRLNNVDAICVHAACSEKEIFSFRGDSPTESSARAAGTFFA